MSRLSEEKLLFIDCQTTGATPARAHVLEIGWAIGRASDLNPPQFCTRLIALPEGEDLPPRIQKITGISAAEMLAANPAAAVAEELAMLISEHKISHAVAHWAQFERTFLSDFFLKYLSAAAPAAPLSQYVCTCQIAKKLYPDLPSRAIRAVGGYFGLDIEEMKRSGGHVETTYFIWQKLALELEQLGLTGLEELQDWLKPAPKVAAPKKSKKAAEVVGTEVTTPAAPIKTEPAKYLLPMERLRRLDLPDQPGVYRLLNSRGRILYVGKATSLKSRVNSYFTGRRGKASKTKELISQVFDFHVSPLATPLEAALLENDLIKEHDPPYNRALKKRDRSLIYFNYQFDSIAPAPDTVHCLGPFPRGSTIEPLILLVEGVRNKALDLRLFWGLLDQECTERAVSLFFAEQNIDAEAGQAITVRRLLALGLSFYRQQLLESLASETVRPSLPLTYFLGPRAVVDEEDKEGKEEREAQEEHEAQDVQEQEQEQEQEVNSDEELCQMVRSLVTGSARAYAMAKTVVRLLDTSVSYEEKKQRRRLIFAEGILQRSEDVAASPLSDTVAEPVADYRPITKCYLQKPIDIATYDRMRVLLAEIRRLYSRGHWVVLERELPAENFAPVLR